MYVHVCACMDTFRHTCIHTYLYTTYRHTYIHKYIYIHTQIHAYMQHSYMHMCIHAYMDTCTHIQVLCAPKQRSRDRNIEQLRLRKSLSVRVGRHAQHTYIRICIHPCMYTSMYVYIHAYASTKCHLVIHIRRYTCTCTHTWTCTCTWTCTHIDESRR